MALYLDAKVGDILQVGDTKVEIVHKSGRSARLKIVGPDEVVLTRPQHAAPREPAHEVTNGRGT